MLKFLQPPCLPNDLKWKFSADTSLMTWTIRARNYDILIANFLLLLLTTLNIGYSLVMYHVFKNTSQPWRTLWPIMMFSLMLLVALSASHQRINCAYRITASGIECCKWKNNFRINPKPLTGITIFASVAIFSLAAITPGLSFVAILGPGAMGIMAWMQLSSQRLQEPYSQYNHLEFEWSRITQLTIATNREIVDLQYLYTGEGYERHWNIKIFCEKGQKESVAALIRPYLSSDVPFIRAKVRTGSL